MRAWARNPILKPGESGMTLLEIIISLMILLSMSMAAATLIRNGIDLKINLSQQSKVTHRLSIAMEKISRDIQHAFLEESLRKDRLPSRRTKAIFKSKVRSDSSIISFTTMSHKPLLMNANESDQTYVMYKVDRDKDALDGGELTHLFRGSTIKQGGIFD